MPGTRVTCEDVDTGESESVVIENNHVVIVDGNRHVGSIRHYPTTGTTVITIKTKKD